MNTEAGTGNSDRNGKTARGDDPISMHLRLRLHHYYHLRLIANLHSIRTIHSCVPSSGGCDPAAAGQVRRGGFILEQPFEYSVRSARHGEHSGKDYHRRGGSFHADRFDALAEGCDWSAFGLAVNRG